MIATQPATARNRWNRTALFGAMMVAAILGWGPAPHAGDTVSSEQFVVLKQWDGSWKRTTGESIVPLNPDRACFGWRLAGIVTAKELTERLLLPDRAERWETGPEVVVADDSKSAVSRFPILNGQFARARTWCLVEGDPPGRYVIELELDGRPVERFEYEVVPGLTS